MGWRQRVLPHVRLALLDRAVVTNLDRVPEAVSVGLYFFSDAPSVHPCAYVTWKTTAEGRPARGRRCLRA
jgi:hypothetical protein